jgi:hypothetical protein
VARRRAPSLLLAALLSAAACGKGPQSRAAEGSDSTGAALAEPAGSAAGSTGATMPNTKGAPQMASTDQDIATVQAALATELKVDPTDVKVRPVKVTVPGITVFSASVNPAKAGRSVTRTGIVQDGAIHVETDAMSRVARAWNYGADRTVPATAVAQVFGVLHSATAGSSAFFDDSTIQTYKKVSGPRRAAALAMPAETTVDGHPAVVYFLTSSSRSIPFSQVTAIVSPDFQVELRAQPIQED